MLPRTSSLWQRDSHQTASGKPGRFKHYFGEAVYRTAFVVPRSWKRGTPLMIDLGLVGDVAAVRVNGQDVGTVWKAPFRIEIGNAVRNGRNTVEIRVATTWVNRLIGDAQVDAKKVVSRHFQLTGRTRR